MTTSSPLTMSTAEQLLAIEAIKQVKSRYAYTSDRHLWDEFVALFAPDGSLDESDFPSPLQPFGKEPVSEEISSFLRSSAGSEVSWPVVGHEAILAQHVGVSDEHMMVHHLMNPQVELTSDTTAAAQFQFESHHWFPQGLPVQYMHNFGAYHETYVRLDDDRWYIQTLRLERRRVECR